MRLFENLEQIEAAVGQHVGHSEWMEITQARIDAFADATGDHQWIHVDPERAADGPYGTTIAHGYLTLSLLPLLVEVPRAGPGGVPDPRRGRLDLTATQTRRRAVDEHRHGGGRGRGQARGGGRDRPIDGGVTRWSSTAVG